MKKYFYYVFEYRHRWNNHSRYFGSGVCETSDNGLFPLISVINNCLLKIKEDPNCIYPEDYQDATPICITNTVEISKDDYLMFNYNEINGNDKNK